MVSETWIYNRPTDQPTVKQTGSWGGFASNRKCEHKYHYFVIFKLSGLWMAGRWLKKAEGTWRRLGASGCSGKLCFFPKKFQYFATSPSCKHYYCAVIGRSEKWPAKRSSACIMCKVYTLSMRWEYWRSLTERYVGKHPVAVAVAWPDDEDSPHLIRCCCCSRGISHQGLTVMHDMKCCWEYCWDLWIYMEHNNMHVELFVM